MGYSKKWMMKIIFFADSSKFTNFKNLTFEKNKKN